jgi:hypothetical protein
MILKKGGQPSTTQVATTRHFFATTLQHFSKSSKKITF